MRKEIYFPRGIATGCAFCNRKSERARLKRNIENGQHTLLMSPRRYGKTSLALFVANEIEIPLGYVDLFVAIDAKKIEQNILDGIKKIILKLGFSIEQALAIIRLYFREKEINWTIGTQGAQIALVPNNDSDPATNILIALQALENLLQKKNKRALLFIDEMQEVGEVATGGSIEGAIRHVAQQTRHLSLVFSGSNRHLLTQMFGDKSRPLYKLCDRIILGRIGNEEYIAHINAFAVNHWNQLLTNEVLNSIFSLTESHPYYVNTLCNNLLENNSPTLPQTKDVTECWMKMLQEDRSEILRELITLSIGQRKILTAIASGTHSNLTGKQSQKNLDLTGPSITEALRVLEQKDYIETPEHGSWRVIDPMLKTALVAHALLL